MLYGIVSMKSDIYLIARSIWFINYEALFCVTYVMKNGAMSLGTESSTKIEKMKLWKD